MAGIWLRKGSSSPPGAAKDDADVADTGLADIGLPAPSPTASPQAGVGCPQLARNQPQPPPPNQPPPPPGPQQIANPQDSLSLVQLRRIVSEFPRSEPSAYDFTYGDAATYEEEVDEWFSYNEAEYVRLRRAQGTFERRWKKVGGDAPFTAASPDLQEKFIRKEVSGLQASDLRRRCKSLSTLLHLCLGVWDESAGNAPDAFSTEETEAPRRRTAATFRHTKSMRNGLLLLAKCDGLGRVFDVMRYAFDRFWEDEYRNSQIPDEDITLLQSELDNVMTIMYLAIEGPRNKPAKLSVVQAQLMELRPNLLDYMVSVIARLRWDEVHELPQTRIFLLIWKAILLFFGDISAVDEVKKATRERQNSDEREDNLITASPLDYHLFRQEIISKYPAYVPPPPLIPIELENNSILPPLSKDQNRSTASDGIVPAPIDLNKSGGSILHQPVHIATPAPSPPPSPAVGGKAGKKQNYQTNQNFPFMYPPLDSTSNSAGGKGEAALQQLVGRKWEGSDIPASILEAGELFANRMRMTRAMRQLWEERERFMKFERGWEASDDPAFENDEDIDELDLEKNLEAQLNLVLEGKKAPKASSTPVDYGPNPDVPETVKARLDAVEDFYRESLPHMQSLVIVLLKTILASVTALITQPGPGFQADPRANGAQGQRRQQESANMTGNASVDTNQLPIVELEVLRSREITTKAVSGILLMLLKWFKISHILKFEYFTQLLLDSNYLPLVLKLYAHQDVDRLVDSKYDREDLSFFTFCNNSSNHGPMPGQTVADEAMDDEDDAVPPPIKLNRDSPQSAFSVDEKPPASAFQSVPMSRDPQPEPEEAGFAGSDVPVETITDFSWRSLFSSINHLRIMQKICKNKAHRNLLMVQYKSSTILKKALKVHQPELRLYTLKLFKNQVPYCGRKWRQGNMRVITSVYLHCRPELRNEWLAGSDVDSEVEESLPLEQALRALTHWHNIKRYPDQMGTDVKILETEHDFFVRELERMDFFVDDNKDESVAEGWEANNW